MTTNDTPGTGPEQDAIERVAEAIADGRGYVYPLLPDDTWYDDFDYAGEDPHPGKDSFRNQARAAIAAMPSAQPVAGTEAMVEAGEHQP